MTGLPGGTSRSSRGPGHRRERTASRRSCYGRCQHSIHRGNWRGGRAHSNSPILGEAFALVVPRLLPFPLTLPVTASQLLGADGGLAAGHGGALWFRHVGDGNRLPQVCGGSVGGDVPRLSSLVRHRIWRAWWRVASEGVGAGCWRLCVEV